MMYVTYNKDYIHSLIECIQKVDFCLYQ